MSVLVLFHALIPVGKKIIVLSFSPCSTFFLPFPSLPSALSTLVLATELRLSFSAHVSFHPKYCNLVSPSLYCLRQTSWRRCIDIANYQALSLKY